MRWSVLGWLAAMVLFVGCETNTAPPIGTVAVIDLDQVAKEVGADVAVANKLKEREVALNGQLKTALQSFSQQMAQKKAEFGEEISDENTQMLAGMQQQAVQKINVAKQRATQDLQQLRTQQLIDFREKVRPIAREVAKGKGLSIIVTKAENIYDVEASVDITSEVANRVKQAGIFAGGSVATAPAATTQR